MTTRIRPARAEDAAFLAVTDLIALRGRVNWGMYDVLFDSEDLRLRFLETMGTAEPRSFIHYSHLLGHSVANVAVLIGNDAAQRAYEKAGFVAYADVCHPDFERAAQAPGMRKLRRPL